MGCLSQSVRAALVVMVSFWCGHWTQAWSLLPAFSSSTLLSRGTPAPTTTTRDRIRQQRTALGASISRDAALAIVPPDEAWDSLQRARHVARDHTYQKWPPCLRLFHPFASSQTELDDLAFSVASVIDKYQIEPFQVHLTEWSVIPHAEAMEADWKALRRNYEEQQEEDDHLTREEREIQELIASEERIGREKRAERAKRHNLPIEPPPQPSKKLDSSPKALWEKQKQMYEEFNGPCVVCLEPDEASRHRIMALREILLEEAPALAAYASYAPTLTLSDTFPLSTSTHSLEYRPLVPIASFPTVTSAVEMARTLRTLWDPLSFDVTDLQVVSTGQENSFATKEQEEEGGTSWLSHHQESTTNQKTQVGCDALIMLAGEEVPMDDQLNQEMVNMIARDGYEGGYNQNKNNQTEVPEAESEQEELNDEKTLSSAPAIPTDSDLKQTDGDTEFIVHWLDDFEEEDEHDEGTVVVIGRTHFFTGEMRLYVGMPAMSPTDAKDRLLGANGLSGEARRRAVVHKSSLEGFQWGQRPANSSWLARNKKKQRSRQGGLSS